MDIERRNNKTSPARKKWFAYFTRYELKTKTHSYDIIKHTLSLGREWLRFLNKIFLSKTRF